MRGRLRFGMFGGYMNREHIFLDGKGKGGFNGRG
jgi:hypothetical protein